MKRKILDPWRVTPEPALEPEKKEPPPYDPDTSEEEHCVQFRGRRAGLNVWFSYLPEEPSSAAVTVLLHLITNLNSYGYVGTLHKHGVDCGPLPERDMILLDRGDLTVSVCPPNGPGIVRERAVESLAFALREIQNQPGEGRELIRKAGVKPYVT